MTFNFHQISIKNQIAIVTLNHPPLNINAEVVMQERCEVFATVLDDPEVRVIIITSAIEGIFGAGSDLKEYITESKDTYRNSTESVLATAKRFIESDKISIAAINGNAIASSADLTLMCDIRVMGEPYYLRWPEVYFALMPNWGASTLLPMMVGRSHALEWLLAGREIHTPELQEAGMLHGVYPVGQALAAAEKLAGQLVKAYPASVRAVKSTVLHSFFMPLQYAFTADVELSTQLFAEPEAIKRTQAFLNGDRSHLPNEDAQ